MFKQKQQVPVWLLGVVAAIVLILVGQRVGGSIGNQALTETFEQDPAAQAAPPGFELPKVDLSSLPPEAQQAIQQVQERLNIGETVVALTPEASGIRARISVSEVKRSGGNLQVRGNLENIADQPLDVPASAFSFRDSAGIAYTLGGSGATTVQPGQTAPFELSVPLPAERGLTLIVTLPPDPAIQQTLVLETAGE
ncbi:MAG: hypothetical protein H7Z42_13055 [Roseiflexaceae bacterium]|nr:hypothetical protein [Roseiflexaceae bacterium]